MAKPYVSLHGSRFGLLGNSLLRVDGRVLKASAATLGGNVFVDSVTGSDSGHDGLSPEKAVATLDAAFAKCTANKGWNIFVLPSHSETVTGAAGIAHDVAGVSVIGIGHGGQQPRFLMDGGTSVTYKISANDAFVSNLNFASGHSDVVTCIDVQVATDAHIDGCRFTNNAVNENFVTCIKSGTTTDNECDGLTVTDCTWMQVDAGSLEFIEILGGLDHLTVTGCIVSHEGTGLAVLVVVTDGDLIQYATITDNVHKSADAAGAVGILQNNGTTNTGILARNLSGNLDTADERIATGENTGLYYYENYTSSVVIKRGYILPARDA